MCFLWSGVCHWTFLSTILTGIVAYNFDLKNPIEYKVPASFQRVRTSYFGLSLALWNPGNTGLEESWIFIGAPRANSTVYQNIIEPGTVFKCNIGKECQEWVMGSYSFERPVGGSWLGGSMQIENGSDPYIVVCGPRWLDQRRPVWLLLPMKGICYRTLARSLLNGNTQVGVSILPQYESHQQYNQLTHYMMGAFGFSMHIVPANDNRNIILGCPGFFHGLGTTIQYSLKNRTPPIPNIYSTAREYEYSGYAVTSGYYYDLPKRRFYAISAPRGAQFSGKVIIFRFFESSTTPENFGPSLIGKQVGEYFGSALASCDIDGDGTDDLIVGAPQWTKIVDEGRIYTYTKNLKHMREFNGWKSGGRFGTAVVCLGDIDYDGYADVAVGAPYDGNGAVYIYHGGNDGLTFTQKIPAPKNTKGFGISISEPKDLDNNGYADIAVGAYLSDNVILFRSKRAVTTHVIMKTLLTEKTLQKNATSFTIEICSSYSGKHAPNQLTVKKTLKIDEILQRAVVDVAGQGRNTYEFRHDLKLNGENQCQNFVIVIKKGIARFLDALTLSVTQHLVTSNETERILVGKSYKSDEDNFNKNSAIINPHHPLAESFLDLSFAVMCGKDNICRSHLSIEIVTNLESRDLFVIGSQKDIHVNVSVTNTGDEAYSAEAVITIPNFIPFLQKPGICGDPEQINRTVQVTCNIGDPLKTNDTRKLNFLLDMSRVPSNTKEIRLLAKAKTDSQDTGPGKNETKEVIKCVARRDIGITRQATMDRYQYILKGREEPLPSIQFKHIYEIKNYEPTPIDEALLSISIPTHWIHADNEIEIIRLNETTGYLNRRNFVCKDSGTNENITSVSYDATTMTEWLIGSNNSMRSRSDNKFTIIGKKIFAESPDNRTLHINCTNPSIKWKTINCELKFQKQDSQSVARLGLVFDLLLSNLTPEIIEQKDNIFFVTNGSVKIPVLPDSIPINNEPDLIMIGTIFTGFSPGQRLPGWVIPLSAFVGLLLLVLIILALYKFGFFKRNKQMELQALLKEQDNATPETGSADD